MITITRIRNYIAYSWEFLFNINVSPVRNIPDISTRHYILQALGLMWAVSFSLAIGSYTVLAASVIGHTVLIGAVAITVATLTIATKNPKVLVRISGRSRDGEHE